MRQEESAKLLEDKVRRAEAEARELELKRMQAEEEKKRMEEQTSEQKKDSLLMVSSVFSKSCECYLSAFPLHRPRRLRKWRKRHVRWPLKQRRRPESQLNFKRRCVVWFSAAQCHYGGSTLPLLRSLTLCSPCSWKQPG